MLRFVSIENTPTWLASASYTKLSTLFNQTGSEFMDGSAVGTTGYCMGGALSLTAAGTFPEHIVAAASYHGGRLATEAPDSPHRLAARMRARIYVAGATADASFPDDMKARLEEALRAAGVEHLIETYAARHGWVPSDTPVHDAAATERHYRSLFALFDATLK